MDKYNSTFNFEGHNHINSTGFIVSERISGQDIQAELVCISASDTGKDIASSSTEEYSSSGSERALCWAVAINFSQNDQMTYSDSGIEDALVNSGNFFSAVCCHKGLPVYILKNFSSSNSKAVVARYVHDILYSLRDEDIFWQ